MLLRLSEISPYIWLTTLYPEEKANAVRQALRNVSNWTPATVRGPSGEKLVRQDIRHCMVVSMAQVPTVEALLSESIQRLASGARRLLHDEQLKPSVTSIVKYEPGGFYRDHCDSGSNDPRLYSLITYLNDDFSGGGTVFVNKGLTIKPHAGQAVMFRSDELHRGDTVLRGMKYVATTWLYESPARG